MKKAEHRITDTILSLLRARAPGATICPSEVARSVAPVRWRPLMPQVRSVAVALARDGRLEIRQRGLRIREDSAFSGPIRLALPSH